MASTGKRVRAILGEILEREPESINNDDELIKYGFGRANYFSLLEKVEKELGKDLQILDKDIDAMMAMATVKDLIDLIEKMLTRR